MTPEMHRVIYTTAAAEGTSVNAYLIEMIARQIQATPSPPVAKPLPARGLLGKKRVRRRAKATG